MDEENCFVCIYFDHPMIIFYKYDISEDVYFFPIQISKVKKNLLNILKLNSITWRCLITI